MTFRTMLTLAIIILYSTFIGAGQTPGITSKNWTDHPAVKEIRDMYAEVMQLMEAKKLVRKEKNFEDCEPYQDTVRIVYADSRGTIRNYYVDAGSDDSMVRRDFYYDKDGKLRFAFIRGGAVNGTKIEHRIYFDPSGKRIWEIQKLVEGPGYTFPQDTWPDDEIVYDPIRAFSASNICKEEVVKSR